MARVFLLTLCSGFFVACSVYDPGLVAKQSQSSCTLKKLPTSPSLTDDGEDIGELWFATSKIRLQLDDGEWQEIGFDIDGLCTTADQPLSSCMSGAGTPSLDGDGGVDNVVAQHVMPLALSIASDLESDLEHSQRRAIDSPTLVIYGWNGEDNDPLVYLSFSQSVYGLPAGTEDLANPLSVHATDSDIVFEELNWDGTDRLWLDESRFVQGDINNPVDRVPGYIRDRQLVAQLPNRRRYATYGEKYGIDLVLTDMKIYGKISKDNQEISPLLFTGRWPVGEFINTMLVSGVGCKQGDVSLYLEQLIDSVADVREDPSSTNASLACDALSMSSVFEAHRIIPAGLAPRYPPQPRCSEQ
ncbi:MAG: hypothetical protein IPJ88_04585 [Myxococcales bacterium]|nr:MAG: hypothetical protein IPJ88_04585 [Myxococcales bacterium]